MENTDKKVTPEVPEHEHKWEVLKEDNWGEQDYSSYGGGVNEFIVTLYGCPVCGALKKEHRGDFNGEPPADVDEITEDDMAMMESYMEYLARKRALKEKFAPVKSFLTGTALAFGIGLIIGTGITHLAFHLRWGIWAFVGALFILFVILLILSRTGKLDKDEETRIKVEAAQEKLDAQKEEREEAQDVREKELL